jgi:hypothetical protein
MQAIRQAVAPQASTLAVCEPAAPTQRGAVGWKQKRDAGEITV